jgi:hypothetical protein
MRKSIIGAVAALAIASAGGGALIAYAQPAPPTPPGTAIAAPRPPQGPPGMQWRRGPGAGAWQRGPGWRQAAMMHRHWKRMHTFALFFPPADRQLTPPDVQKIAEAFLLWHGNHTWKVIDVAPTPDGQVGFAFAAPDGTVIARFSMDTKTGRLTRTG